MFNVVIKNLIKIKMKNITSGVDFNNVFCAHFSRVFSSERLYSSYVLLRKRKRRVKNVGEIDPICDAIKLHFSYGFISNEIIITIVAVWKSLLNTFLNSIRTFKKLVNYLNKGKKKNQSTVWSRFFFNSHFIVWLYLLNPIARPSSFGFFIELTYHWI